MGYNSVILLDGPVWKKQRRIISAGYTSQALTRMLKEKTKFIDSPARHLVSIYSTSTFGTKSIVMNDRKR
jgi:cytochrome P450